MNRTALKKKTKAIFKELNEAFPNPRVELDYSNALELLVATVLSAQCTDVKVNEVTKTLFAKYCRAKDYLDVLLEELEEDIHPTGFFRQKAKNIRGAMQIVIEEHGGQVPADMESLTRLPGIGRKSANVILGNMYDIPGIVVDTHVGRVSRRLGLTEEGDPVKVEHALGALLPQKHWTIFGQIMVLQGRYICKARKPLCDECALMPHCNYFRDTVCG